MLMVMILIQPTLARSWATPGPGGRGGSRPAGLAQEPQDISVNLDSVKENFFRKSKIKLAF